MKCVCGSKVDIKKVVAANGTSLAQMHNRTVIRGSCLRVYLWGTCRSCQKEVEQVAK